MVGRKERVDNWKKALQKNIPGPNYFGKKILKLIANIYWQDKM